MTAFKVACDYLCVPDGRDKQENLQLSVQLTPILYADAPEHLISGQDFVSIEQWPEKIAEMSKNIEVYIAPGDDTSSETVVHSGASIFHDFMQKKHSVRPEFVRAKLANELWAKAFRYKQSNHEAMRPADFGCLKAALTEAWEDTVERENILTALTDRRSADVAQILTTLDRGRNDKGLVEAGSRMFEIWQKIMSKGAAITSQTELLLNAGMSRENVTDMFAERAQDLRALDEDISRMFSGDEKLSGMLEGVLHHAFVAMDGAEDNIKPVEDDSFDEGDWGKQAAEAGKRKLSAILSVPSLAHYLGCGLQLTIPSSTLPHGLEEGLIRVRFAADENHQSQWTAFSIGDEAARGFGVRPEFAAPYKGDHINMRHEENGVRRYWMHQIAPQSSLVATIAALNSDPEDEDAAFGSEIKRRGLACFDRFHTQQIAADDHRDRRNPIDNISYQEDLVRGVRPDVGVADTNGEVPAGRWRQLVQREVRCLETEFFDPEFYDDPSVVEFLLPRDHGIAIAPEESQDPEKVDNHWIVPTKKEPELFIWAGESLAVTRSEDPEDASASDLTQTRTGVSELYDLGFNMEYRLTGDLLPPLRQGFGYAFGARLCYVNGAGMSFDKEIYESDPDLVLGEHADEQDVPMVFTKGDSKAPDTHLLWTDKLITANSVKSHRGESCEVLVIRDNSGTAQRIVTPPRISFDEAEIQGQFDGSSGKPLRGAFARRGGVKFWLAPDTGSFPEARFSSLRYLVGEVAHDVHGRLKPVDLTKLSDLNERQRELAQPLGTVAYLGRNNAKAAPYYVDRDARLLAVALEDKVAGKNIELESIPFWEDDDQPWQAEPIVVRLRRGNHALETDSVVVRGEDGVRVRLQRITARLPRAARAKLVLTCSGNSTFREIELVHADSRPDAPRIDGIAEPNQGINAVCVTVSKNRPWSDYVGGVFPGDDMLKWSGEEGGATAYFVGRVGINRRETNRLRAEAQWDEFTSNTIQMVEDDNGRKIWKSIPQKHSAKLFEIDVDDTDLGHADEGWINLLFENKTTDVIDSDLLRQLSYNFPDGRARRLSLNLTATSAFGDYYRLGAAESQSKSEIEVKTDCTFRPPPPIVERSMPVFVWKRDKRTRTSKRSSRIRIYLGEDWYASGVGEQLGVVLAPEEGITDPCSYYSEELAPFQRFLSRPGGDPARESDAVTVRLTAGDFKNSNGSGRGRLYLAKDATSDDPISGLSLDVNLALYDIKTDDSVFEQSGAYVEIEVDLGDAYQPFLHLGLVRYQGQALEHLELSHPVEYIVHWLPDRELSVRNTTGSKWQAKIKGSTYSIPGTRSYEPMFRATLFGFQEGRRRPLPILEPRWVSILDNVKVNRVAGGPTGFAEWRTEQFGISNFDFKHFMLQIEEFEPLVHEPDGDVSHRLVYSEEVRFSDW